MKKIRYLFTLFILISFSILFISGCAHSSKLVPATVTGQLEKAESFSAQGEYREAIIIYEELIEKNNIKNSKIYFNCANSYYQLNNHGKAIFFYLQALKIDPHNKKIKANLSIVRTKRDGGWKQTPPASFFNIANSLFAWLIPELRLILFLFFSTTFWGLLTLRLLKMRPKRKHLLYIAAILSFIVGLSLCFDLTKQFHPKEGVIFNYTEGRSADHSSAEPLFPEQLPPGVEFTILQERSGWILIKLKRGGECWIESSSAGITE